MGSVTLALKRPFIWLRRFRHRCGYGVHSPFAFDLITRVIYEKAPYYKYKDLAEEEEKLAPEKGVCWEYESRKVKRLLFRLVNYARPDTLVDFGTLSASSLYLKAGKEGADYLSASSLSELFSGGRRCCRFSLFTRLPSCRTHEGSIRHLRLLCNSEISFCD